MFASAKINFAAVCAGWLVLSASAAPILAAEPPIDRPIGVERSDHTGKPPARLMLPLQTHLGVVFVRSPYCLESPPQGCFSNEHGTTEFYSLSLAPTGDVATLKMELGTHRKAVRKWREDGTLSVDRVPFDRGLAWSSGGEQTVSVARGDLVVIYQDLYLVEELAPQGVTLERVTEACPPDLRPAADCRPIPCQPGVRSPLFYDKRFPQEHHGELEIRQIAPAAAATAGDRLPTAQVTMYRPNPTGRGRTPWGPVEGKAAAIRASELLELPGFQAYRVRRVVESGRVDLGEGRSGVIRSGWIEIETTPAADAQKD